jgi:ribosomal protein L32
MSSDEKTSGKRTDRSLIHTFGCRVWVKHTGAKLKKYNIDSKKGQHLGHLPGGTKKNSLWVDDATGKVKLGYHLCFDEGMNDLALDKFPLNMQIFLHSGAAPSIEEIGTDEDSEAMMFYSSIVHSSWREHLL